MPKLAKKNSCTGCTACVSACPKHCIEIIEDANGFGYPRVQCASECIECGACEKACPLLNEIMVSKQSPMAYAAISMDESVRMESSSGGIFSEIAKNIIEKNGVVYGAAYDGQFQVYHICVDDEEGLSKLRGAKYAESKLENTFLEIRSRLQQGQNVLFSGTPCQVAGLKSFVKKDYDNLFCIDFVCHGVPAPVVWKSYIDYRAKEDAGGSMPCAINLRSKETGWTNYQYSNVFEYSNGTAYSIPSSQSLFMKLFVGDYISRSACAECTFKGYNRVSDFTLGDFWGIWDINPEMDDNKGTSVVLVHSEKANVIWRDISSRIKYKEVSLEQASQKNPSMMMPSKSNLYREVMLEKIRNGEISDIEKMFVVPRASLLSQIGGKVKQLLKRL